MQEHNYGFPYEVACGVNQSTTKDKRKNAEDLASMLLKAFGWRESDDGFDYWYDVYNRLLRISWVGR